MILGGRFSVQKSQPSLNFRIIAPSRAIPKMSQIVHFVQRKQWTCGCGLIGVAVTK